MSKIFIVLFAGIFVSSVAYEILHRVNPELLKKAEDMLSTKLDSLFEVQAY